MVIKILAVIAGFIVWSVVFVGGEALTRVIAPAWVAPADATFVGDAPLLLTYLVRSVIASVLAGFTASLIAKDSAKIPFILAIILLLVGLMVQIGTWNMVPVWYNIVFLILLVPMTMLGAKLKSEG
jgi:hypothetical protein